MELGTDWFSGRRITIILLGFVQGIKAWVCTFDIGRIIQKNISILPLFTIDHSMALHDKIRIIDRKLLSDTRGWFLKVLNGMEEFLPAHTGESYITMALPGEWRANHYHPKTAEWFTVFKGKAK